MSALAQTDGWSFQDLGTEAAAHLPGDPQDYEVVAGRLVRRPPMTFPHNGFRRQIAQTIDVQLPTGWQAEYELAVQLGRNGRRADFGISRTGAAGRWRQVGYEPQDVLMLGEVVSPSSRTIDRVDKPGEYARAGIPHFWLVELEPELVLTVHRLVGAAYEPVERLTGSGQVTLPFPLTLDLPAMLPPLLD